MRAWTIRLVVASSLGLSAFAPICGCSDETNPFDPSFGTADLTDPTTDQGGEDVPFGPLLITAEAFDPDSELCVRFVAEAIDGRNPPFDQILWDFGDGNEGMGTRVVHDYEGEDQYLVRVAGFDCIFRTLEIDEETGTPTIRQAASLLDFIIKVKRFKVSIEANPGQGHTPLATRFTGEVGLPCGHSAAGYHWDFGDGGTADGSLVVQHTFADPNSYPVELTVITDRGWAYVGAATVEATQPNRPPQAQIEATPSAGEAPLTVVFDGSASTDTDGEIVSHAWQFGDGKAASGQVVEHTYANEGDYTARLTVTDDDGAAHANEVVVHVDAAGPIPNQLPTACLGVEPATGTAPLEVAFDARCSTDTDGVINSWLWDFGDGVSTAGAEVTHTYSNPGDYTASLTVIDDDGGSDQAEVVVHVNGAPSAEFVVSMDYNVAPTVVHFSAANSTDADGQITHYSWQFGDGSTEEGPDKVTVDHTYTDGGAYIVRLTVTDDDAATARDTAWVALGALAVSPPSLDFGDTAPQQTIEVSNTGSRALEYNVSVDYGPGPDGWLSAVPAAGSCGAAQTVTVTIEDDRTVLPAGTHTAEIQVRAGNVTRTVGATIAVVAVATSIDSHDFGTDSAVWQFDVWNAGAGVLSFEVATQPDWLQVAGAPGTSSGAQDTQTLTLTVDRAGLAPGVYAGDLVLIPAAGQGDLSKTIALTMEVAEPGALSVSPADGLVSGGTQGGPFSPLSKTFTVSNGGQTALTWSVAKTQDWVTLSKSGGTLAAGGSDTVTVTINALADGLSAGTHSDTVTFTNSTNGDGNTTRPVTLTVNAPGSLSVSPGDGLVSGGTQGGPFSPLWKTFTVTNGGQTALDWSVAKTQSWLTLSKTAGTLAPGANDTITVSINAQGNSLNVGTHTDIVTFTNESNGQGTTTRPVELSVNSLSNCETSTANWQNFSFAPQAGVFMAEFEATPSQANMDGVIAISAGGGASYADFAVLVRFNSAGNIDVRNGSSYTANTTVPYAAGTSYHFRLVIDIPSSSYSVYVTPQSASEATLGTDYAFRSEQNGVSSLDNWALIADPGSVEVCSFTIGPAPGALSVAPTEPFNTSGFEGGPFSPTAKQYTLTNTGGSSINWSASKAQGWASLSKASGSLAARASDTVTVSINANANSLAAAVYSDTIAFINVTNGNGDTTRSVSLRVDAAPGPLSVTPDEEFNSSGSEGGPFSPSTKQYTLTNTGGSAIAWTAGKTQAWVGLSKTSGSLATGASDTVTVSINANANGLPAGSHFDTVAFVDTTNVDTVARPVSLMVTGGIIYYVDKNHANANDSNAGTEESDPWRTLAKAASAAQAGDTVLIKAGTYYETLAPANSGAPGAMITFKAYPGHECQGAYGGTKTDCQVVIDGQASRFPVSITRDYIRIEGLDIRNSSGSDYSDGAITVDDVQHIEVANNYVHDNGGAGIHIKRNCQALLIDNNEIFRNGADGITLYYGNDVTVRANNIHYNYADGVQWDHRSSNIIVEHNTMYDQCHTDAHQDALEIEGGTNIIIRYNDIKDFTQLVYLSPTDDNQQIRNVEVYGNTIYTHKYHTHYNSETQGVFVDGAKGGGIYNVKIHSNTFGWLGYDAVWAFGTFSGVTIRNNIIYQGGISTGKPGEVDSDYNLFFEGDRVPSFEGPHSIIGNPGFVNYEAPVANPQHSVFDFHLTPVSPAIDAGDPELDSLFTLPLPFTDLDGNVRPHDSAYDIGAYEYSDN